LGGVVVPPGALPLLVPVKTSVSLSLKYGWLRKKS